LGFALTYSFAITTLLQWSVRQMAEAENMMTSVERITEYAELPPEPGYKVSHEDYKRDPDLQSVHHKMTSRERTVSETKAGLMKYQPVASSARDLSVEAAGLLELKDLTVTYHPDMDPVLRDISFKVPAGAKLGICGRTGSGKSSTLLALLRLNIVTGGDIMLDGTSLLKMSLEEARAQLSSIPQDPHLFSGTLRFNVDPFSVYSDEEIWAALEDACIKPYIASDSNGLNMLVDEGGKNFSVGQRQLISMSRAILRRCPVVLMDEVRLLVFRSVATYKLGTLFRAQVTASIDYDTDRSIQQTIRTSPALCNSTIVTVAHRLRTIADSDLIAVVDKGRLAELGSPLDLLQKPESLFHALAMESQEHEEILRLATEASTSK
jgi:ABC-type multidrug transport system fused ATPase/permease subunit